MKLNVSIETDMDNIRILSKFLNSMLISDFEENLDDEIEVKNILILREELSEFLNK
jgi:hypothetical protein